LELLIYNVLLRGLNRRGDGRFWSYISALCEVAIVVDVDGNVDVGGECGGEFGGAVLWW
jgi:hypothetical protein